MRYNKSERVLRCVFEKKLRLVLKCKNTWPIYATYEEDKELRIKDWDKKYDKKRVVMWDNTDIPIFQPTSAEAQRNTYSQYYAGNVAKGGVFIQLCSWMGTYQLWQGAVSDTEYMEKSGILIQQEQYLQNEDATNNNIPWTIILDKGYRITSAAWRTGGQFTLQPTFARSDEKFATDDTIRSAEVASTRGANERGVRLAKSSDYVAKGLLRNGNAAILDNAWQGWGFLCNFRSRPVISSCTLQV